MIIHPRYETIYADPPWSYQNWRAAKNGAAVSAMEVMRTDDICRVPVGEKFADKNCHLFLWGTWPKLPDALRVMDAWGFAFVTGFPWVKYTPSTGKLYTGIGFWTQGMSEYLLIGRRGKPKKGKTKAVKGLICGSDFQFYAPRTKHSEKPLEVQTWIERVSAEPRLELFARTPRPGWTSWGLDLGFKLDSNDVHLKENDHD
jgi:N6-adenosine-specific RNA methylase IME4